MISRCAMYVEIPAAFSVWEKTDATAGIAGSSRPIPTTPAPSHAARRIATGVHFSGIDSPSRGPASVFLSAQATSGRYENATNLTTSTKPTTAVRVTLGHTGPLGDDC